MGKNWQQDQEQPRRPLPATVVVLAVAGLIVLVGMGAIYLTAGGSGSESPSGSAAMAPGTQATAASSVMLPDYVMAAPKDTQMAYQFALDRPDVMMWVPCYCGCGGHSGHKNARDCFVQESTATSATFDEHGAGCGVCVGIALEAKRLTEEGKSLRQIRAAVDEKFGAIGPGTDTPLPPG